LDAIRQQENSPNIKIPPVLAGVAAKGRRVNLAAAVHGETKTLGGGAEAKDFFPRKLNHRHVADLNNLNTINLKNPDPAANAFGLHGGAEGGGGGLDVGHGVYSFSLT
jgi:hypothetical protein